MRWNREYPIKVYVKHFVGRQRRGEFPRLEELHGHMNVDNWVSWVGYRAKHPDGYTRVFAFKRPEDAIDFKTNILGETP